MAVEHLEDGLKFGVIDDRKGAVAACNPKTCFEAEGSGVIR